MRKLQNSNINYFNFKIFSDGYLLSNDTGSFLFLREDEFTKFIQNNYVNDMELSRKLIDNHFVIDTHKELFVDEVSGRVRRIKSYLFESTQLHIFILTGNCNQGCIYCQASARKGHIDPDKNMNFVTAEKSVDIALSSPSKNLTFEFQGGEPLLNFDVLKHIVEYTKKQNASKSKNVIFNLVTNLIALDNDKLEYLLLNRVTICTSIDGPKFIHKKNRPCDIPSFFDKIKNNIIKINELVSAKGINNKVQAIQTTTRHSLNYPKEIIDEYISIGFHNIFLRPLTPLGFANESWESIGYSPEMFVKFYKEALNYIIDLSCRGVSISENYATILLKKIITKSPINYMELRSPCGGSIGQLAYNYDGFIYTCDEGRMVAETGDHSFRLGNVLNSSYNELVCNPVTKSICISSCLEIIPGCEECVYSPYCGTCPIYSYVHGGSIFSIMPGNYKCRINKGILDVLFEKIIENDTNVMNVFENWVNK